MINHIFPTLLYSKKLSLNDNYKKQLLDIIKLLSLLYNVKPLSLLYNVKALKLFR